MVKYRYKGFVFFLLVLIIFVGIIFRKFWLQGLYPIPFNNLVLLHFPYTSGGWDIQDGLVYQGGFFASDVYRQMIPWKSLAIEQIKTGSLPLWNPYNFSGEPLLANIQTTLLYPLTILFFITDFYSAWSLYVIAAPIIACVGMFFFLRELKLSLTAAIMGALSFGFSTRMITWFSWGVVTHSGVWLPTLLYSTLLIIKRKKFGIPLMLIGLFSTVVAGYPQESVYSLLVWFTFTLVLLIKKKPSYKNYKQQLGFLLIGAGLITSLLLVQVIPTFVLYQNSTMKALSTGGNYLDTQMHPWQLLTFLAPDYFGNRVKDNYWADSFTQVDYLDTNLYFGVLGLFVIFQLIRLTQLVYRKKYKKISGIEKFTLIWLVIALGLALDTPVSDLFGSVHIPMLTSGAAVGINYITIFCLVLLSSFGLHNWSKNKPKKPTYSLALVYLFILISLVFVPDQFRSITLRNLVIPVGLSSILWLVMVATVSFQKRTLLSKLFVVSLVLFSLFDFNRQARLMITYAQEELAYPEHVMIEKIHELAGFDRVIGFWDGEITTNLHTAFKIFSAEGYNPLHYYPYQELISGARNSNYPEKLSRSDADLYLHNAPGRDRFMQLASIKYVTSKVIDKDNPWEEEPLKYPPEKFTMRWQKDNFKIFEFLPALDRVSLYKNYQVIPDKIERIRTLYSTDFDPTKTIIIESDINGLIDDTATGSARIVEYQPNTVTIETTIQGSPMLLLLTDSYYPNWKAFIDGVDTPILKANHAFRAIEVPEGDHTVVFQVGWL